MPGRTKKPEPKAARDLVPSVNRVSYWARRIDRGAVGVPYSPCLDFFRDQKPTHQILKWKVSWTKFL